MRYSLQVPVLIVFLILFQACSTDAIENETVLADQKYGSLPEQNYDIYLPENRTSETPVIILVHGGFWVYGDKSDMNSLVTMAKTLAPDYAVVNMNYRLANANSNHYPVQLEDISLLIEDLESKKASYHISNNYYFIGVSAGGHLSLLYAYKEDIAHNIKAVCSIVGPTDFLDPYYHGSDVLFFQSIMLPFLGYTYEEDPKLYQDASPKFYVDQWDAPTILFYGDKDELVPLSQATRLVDKLIISNVPYEFNILTDTGHDLTEINDYEVGLKIAAFFNAHK